MALRLPKLFKPKVKAKVFGKKRELKKSVKDRTEGKRKDVWPNQGEVKGVVVGNKAVVLENRYKKIYTKILKKDHVLHFLKTGKKNPNLLILGAGFGQDIILLKRELLDYNIKPKIDVLGIQKTIDPKLLETKIVNKDLSSGKAIEEISQEPQKNKKLISKLKERYDMVVAPSSAGLHTLYPAFNVFNISCMLKKGGIAYIEVPTKELINDKEKGHFDVPEKYRKPMIAQLEKLPEIVQRFLKSYGGENFSREFSFKNIDYLNSLTSPTGQQKYIERRYIRYIKVERK
jgi:hypothetical protein